MQLKNNVELTLKSEFWLHWFSFGDIGKTTPQNLGVVKNDGEIMTLIPKDYMKSSMTRHKR